MRRLSRWWWVLLLSPALFRMAIDWADGRSSPGAWALYAMPAAVLLAAMGCLSVLRTPVAFELSKELRLLAPGLVTCAGLCSLQALSLDEGQLSTMLTGPTRPFAATARVVLGSFGMPLGLVGLFAVASLSFGREMEERTLATWLMVPRRKWVLVARKLFVLGMVLGLEVAQLRLGPSGLAPVERYAGAMGLLALSTSGGTLLFRHPSGNLTAALIVFCASAVAVVVGGEIFGWFVFVFLCASALVGTLWLAQRFDPLSKMPAFRGRALASVLRLLPSALVRKEVMLQRGVFVAAGGTVVLWGLATLEPVRHRLAGLTNLTWQAVLPVAFFCAFGAGSLSFSQEYALGTAAWQETVVARSRVWRVKVLVSLAVALATALVLPFALVAISPGWSTALRDVHITSAATGEPAGADVVAQWVMIGLAAWAVGVLASTLAQRSVVASFAAAIGIGLVLVPAALLMKESDWDLILKPFECTELRTLPASASRALEVLERALWLLPAGAVLVAALWTSHDAWKQGLSLRRLAASAVVVLLVLLAASAIEPLLWYQVLRWRCAVAEGGVAQ